jgi:hypothetical protein
MFKILHLCFMETFHRILFVKAHHALENKTLGKPWQYVDLVTHFQDKGHNIPNFVKNVIGLGYGTLQDFPNKKMTQNIG